MSDDFSYPPPPQPTEPTPPAAAYTAPPAYAAPPQPYGAYAPAAPRRRSGLFWFFTISGSLLALFLIFAGLIWAAFRTSDSDTADIGSIGSGKIAVIDISGVIMTADGVDAQLRKFGEDSSVKAIILHINSPGGGAAASQEIYHEVLRVRKENHKKIIASVESVGASGAYYIASACDKIYANDASVVGSIGVIMEWMNYGDLMRWAKLKNVTITAGELKDAGDPSRDLTPKEQAYFQTLVDNMHSQFIHDVAQGRAVSEDKIKPLATGQVWTGQQAVPLGLIDRLGGFRIALMDTAKDVGISGEPNIVRPPHSKRNLLSILASDPDDLFPNPSKLLEHAPGFYFMWK